MPNIPCNKLTLFLSLSNKSNDVRWSIDLRWQSPHENWGFYDIAEGIIFRSSTETEVKPDWDKFLSVDRKEVWQKKYFKQVSIVYICGFRLNVVSSDF